ncbi:MAG: laminin G domain-containing protein [Kiritimatiellae bacterium]|nr:laminin G domain-containing protein [Kiritimatiellia bacterium]
MKNAIQARTPYAATLTMSCAMLALQALFATDFVPSGHDSHTILFYPLTGYENGTRWTVPAGQELTYTNSTYGASAPLLMSSINNDYVITPRLAQRGYVTVTNETPGRYLFANKNAKAPLVSDYMSIRAVTCPEVWGKYGSWFGITDFGKKMSQAAERTGAFTLEFFLKPNDPNCCGNATWFDIGDDDGYHRVLVQIPASESDPSLIRVTSSSTVSPAYRSDIRFSRDARDSQWHHVAIVYEQPDNTADGYVRVYFDYQAAAQVAYVRRDTTKGNIRFGERGYDRGWPGLFSAIRVSDKALTPDEMLRASDDIGGVRDAETMCFYPLTEMPNGHWFDLSNCDTRTDAERTYWTGTYMNRASVAGYACSGKTLTLGVKQTKNTDPNASFYSTNDVPARYVYAGVDATAPLCELQTSLCELGKAKAGGTTLSDWMSIAGLAADFYKEDEYTLEFFVKFLSVPDIFGFFDQGPVGENRVILQRSAASLRASFGVKTNGSTAYSYSTVTYPDVDWSTGTDGKWHHVALVYDGSDIRLFCDYTLAGNAVALVKGATIASEPLARLGEGNQWAHYSCIRATAKALDPTEFLYASNEANGVLPSADWSWRLDGTVSTAVSRAVGTASLLDTAQYLFKDAHGFTGMPAGSGSLTYIAPAFAGGRTFDGVEAGKNLSAARVDGAYLSAVSEGPLCAPGLVFTAEALVDAVAPASGSATVFGAENVAGGSAWNLAVDSAGALYLNYTLQDGTAASAKVGDGFAGLAHHVALVADMPNRALAVYVDYSERLFLSSTDIAEPLSSDGLHFVAGGGCGNAVLSGTLDEVCLTHDMLTCEQFLRVTSRGLQIIFR